MNARLERCVFVIITVITLSKVSALDNECITAGNQKGVCVSIRECPLLYSYYQLVKIGELPESEATLLFKSSCGHPDAGAKVCCRLKRNDTLVIHGVPLITTTPSSLNPKTGADLLESPETCGKIGLTDRITHGKRAKFGHWPWMVIFRSINKQGSSRWTCGGSLISSRYVLSAAHCFINTRVEFARIGEYTLNSNPDCQPRSGCAPQPQDIKVEHITVFPNYSTSCGECDDIALIRLERPATLNKFVVPICLPLDPKTQMGVTEEDFKGLLARVAGWGSVTSDKYNRIPADTLQTANLKIQDLSYCEVLKRKLPNKSTAICAGSGDGIDTCNGDSGGPMTLSNKVGTQIFLVGITSRGPEACGSKNTQGLYTNVVKYIPWIISQLRP